MGRAASARPSGRGVRLAFSGEIWASKGGGGVVRQGGASRSGIASNRGGGIVGMEC